MWHFTDFLLDSFFDHWANADARELGMVVAAIVGTAWLIRRTSRD
jgi:hypothetical protein